MVHGFGFVLVAVAIGLMAGCLLGAQPSVNGQLGRYVEHPLQASLISFASGTAIILVLSLFSGSFPPTFTVPPRELPWWIWFGGSIGVIMVTTSLILVPRVGSLPWFAAVMTGQTVAALVLDHYGLLGNPRSAATPMRLLGAALLIAGVVVIVQAKRIEYGSGANSAGQGAVFFSRYASKVTMLVRGTALEKGMSRYLVDQIEAIDNIEVLTRSEVTEFLGDDRLRGVVVRNNDTRGTCQMDVAAVFIFIGAMPHTDMLEGVAERNRAGFILTGQDFVQSGQRPKGWKLKRDPFFLETSVPGIFAAGDVRQGAVRRVASAVGEGAIAVSLVHQYLRSV